MEQSIKKTPVVLVLLAWGDRAVVEECKQGVRIATPAATQLAPEKK